MSINSSSQNALKGALVTGFSLALAMASLADYYVSSGPLPIGSGQVFRFADDGTPKGAFGTMGQAVGMAWLEDDVLLVCDYGYGQARLFHADGTDLGLFASGVDCISPLVDSYGDILIAEYVTGTIRRFSSAGTDLGVFATTGLSRHDQLAMDADGNIYVSSLFPGEQTIYRYDRDGNFLGVFADFNSAGLLSPTGLAFQSDGSMLVSNTIYDTVDKLDSAGNLVGQFAATGMFEAEWLTVLPDDSVLLPSWSGGWVEKYASDGTDLGVFVNVPHCYHILAGPEIVAPTGFTAIRGRVASGSTDSLSEADNDVLQVCRFFVINSFEPPVQIDVTGTTTLTSPGALSVAVTSQMANSGAFQQQLIMVDKNGVQSPTARRTDALGLTMVRAQLAATGDPADFVRPDGLVKLRINVKPTGPTATLSWCYNVDRVAWTVRP